MTITARVLGLATALGVAGALLVPRAASAAVPSSWMTEQVQVIQADQLSDGAILGPGTQINPYFANNAAVSMARVNTPAADAIVLKWLHWYFAHLNAQDVNGLQDTIYTYDYDPNTGAETSANDYDSVDSYAATALKLAYAAYATGDSQLQSLVSGSLGTYEAIANLEDYSPPTGLRQPDGLTVAKPGSAEYTMDNAEVYSGLSDFSKLEALIGTASSYYGQWAGTSQTAIQNLLWNGANHNWDWANGSASVPPSSGQPLTFYPQATAQLWPVLYGVVTSGSTDAGQAWSAFTGSYPQWSTDVEPDFYPWTVMARAGQLMGAGTGADQLLTTLHTRETRATPAWSDHWYDGESGWFVLAALGAGP
jgi:hypothetical protein